MRIAKSYAFDSFSRMVGMGCKRFRIINSGDKA